MQDECAGLLQSFFREARQKKKEERDLLRKSLKGEDE
jgi:hypothetical protein